uniref:Envelope glycoprotein n=1 Tax=Odocoileus hemionus TaxID=9872 RepID=G9I7H0_ODOHE|nr:envelope glycoprotein [Odocoileus hemionus]AHI49865.1 envelope glycoprotein [Odocoileus hemionus]AHI49869.1 envelope glycoprotein [Odocoileus hemionus]AHI49871.1 envelope glycoprotein [Odocoileus hemionus]AHI49876.1 envelope glycoprotein [Odocoileus hemionus]
MEGECSSVGSFETEAHPPGSLLVLLLMAAIVNPGMTSHGHMDDPHHPVNMTWVVYNPETGKLINSSSIVAPRGTWWPILTFDLCVLVADSNGFGPHQLSDFFAHGTFGLFTHGWNKVPVYVCPGDGRDRSQINKCGGVDSFYCAAWGCETTGTVDWLRGDSNRDLISVKSDPNHRNWQTMPKPGQCFPLQIEFTDEGKRFTRWDFGRVWGLRLYKNGYDTGVRFELKLKLGPLYLAPKVALGPNQVIAPKPPSSRRPSPEARRTSEPGPSKPGLQGTPTTVSPLPPDPLWALVNAAFATLNNTDPNATQSCWLCYNPRPPYYEAIGLNVSYDLSSGQNPPQCRWEERKVGLTMKEVWGQGLCLGTVPRDKTSLCAQTEGNLSLQGKDWIVPRVGGWWICSHTGLTPCLNVKVFNQSQEFCVLVAIMPKILYHSEEVMYSHWDQGVRRKKREPLSVITMAALFSLGLTGAGTGIASLSLQTKELSSLRAAIDEDLTRIEESISHLEKSLTSLSEVVLQNRRGLDLVFLQQGGVCAALGEECCFYADHTGVVRDSMAKVREGLAQRKREREAQRGWWEWFGSWSPWLTTLVSTLLGPLLLLILILTIGPCILNRLITFIRTQLNTIQIMVLRQQYRPIGRNKEEEDSSP